MIQIYTLHRILRLLTPQEAEQSAAQQATQGTQSTQDSQNQSIQKPPQPSTQPAKHPVTHTFRPAPGEDLAPYPARFAAHPEWEVMELVVEEPQEALPRVFATYKKIEAAGGLVRNEKGEYLFIHRLGCWDLPKGKHEEGEQPQETALREVAEECGLRGHRITGLQHITYHCYALRGENILKKTWWYAMEASSTEALQPQTEEDICLVRWVHPAQEEAWADCCTHTYASIGEVLRAIKA